MSKSVRDGERLRWRSDNEKSVLSTNFERRGWTRCDDNDWNVYWASPHTIKQIFSPDNGIRLSDSQMVNHFPNHLELTRKDLMVKNLKRYRKELERVAAERAISDANQRNSTSDTNQRNSSHGNTDQRNDLDLDFECIPTTFILPADYALLAEEFRRSPNSMWIMKPTSKSQGIGIFIVNRLSQIKRWVAQRVNATAPKDAYVCSRYIADPLLIGGKKFDLRLYVLVVGYRPLKVYVYRRGFARFSSVNYSYEANELDNDLIHLTNVAIQKHSGTYSHTHGWKWSLEDLIKYIEGTRGAAAASQLMESMGWVIVHSLKACQNSMIHDRHCFECYGYDMMIDDNLKPWLIEVNASPSLSTTTVSDRILKMDLIRDVLELAVANVLEPNRQGGAGRRAAPLEIDQEMCGDFELLYDEGAEIEADRAEKLRKEGEGSRKSNGKSVPRYGRT